MLMLIRLAVRRWNMRQTEPPPKNRSIDHSRFPAASASGKLNGIVAMDEGAGHVCQSDCRMIEIFLHPR